MKRITTCLLILLAVFSMSSCMRMQQVSVKQVESVQLLTLTDSSADVSVALRITNPNNAKILVKACDLNASINNRYVGKVNIPAQVVIPKKSEELYTVLLKADMREVKKVLPSLMFASKALISLEGDIHVKAKGISKKVPVKIQEKIAKKDLKNLMMVKAE